MGDEQLSPSDPLSRVLGFGLLVAFAVCIYSYWHQVQRLEVLCKAITPGTSVAAVSGLAQEQGFTTEDLRTKTADGHFLISIPAPMTMGGKACDIRHDGKVVLGAGLR